MHHLTVSELSRGLAKGEYSSVELTQHFLNRIHQHDKKLNSFITVCEAEALAAAKNADLMRAAKKARSLTGIPIAHKDIFCTKGVKTTCGSKMLHNFIAPYDATLVHQCQEAGMVMLGKTNMDEFAMGSSNETSYYGSVHNPYNLNLVPGGSSGGSAAAVAARLAPIATGTDTGGSIRQPAALCNLTGIKPTYGRVSRYGMIAFASSLDQGGVMALSAEDAAMMLGVISGFDAKDSTSIDVPVPDYTALLNQSLEGITIGLPKEYFDEKLNAPMAKIMEEVFDTLKRQGAKFKEISLPSSPLSVAVYYVVAPAECSSNLSRYDGVRFGYRCENPVDLEDLYTRSRSEAFGAEVKRRIMIGTYVLSAGYYDAYYLQAQKVRRLIQNELLAAFQEVDFILSPTTPNPAFALGDKSADPISMYLSDIYTISANLAGLPAMSMPAGFMNGLPVGAQLIGPHFSEARLLNVAHQYQQVTDWHKRLPEGF